MKVKTFVKYLENIREDEFSHLNNDLPANKKNEARWPEDDYEYEDDSTKDYGDYDDWYDDEDEKYYSGKKSSNPKFDDDDDDYVYDDDDDDDDEVSHLTYLLRQMFKNSGVDNVQVTAKRNEDIVIEVRMPKKDNLRSIIKVFEVANKLKRDILAQYDAEFDMWSSKNDTGAVLSFGFTLDEGLDDDNMPF